MHICRNSLRTAILSVLTISTGFAHAGELKWTHYGTRPLAMGNAFVAVADDYNALFYNPAGLARLPSWSMEIVNPSIAISKNTIATYKDVSTISSGGASDSTGKDSTSAVLDTFNNLSGKSQYINIGLTPHLIFPGFGLGVGVDVGGSMVVHMPQITADVDAGILAIAPIGYARSMLEDRLSLGVAVKGIFRAGVDRNFSLADISAFSKSDGTDSSEKKLKDYIISGKGLGVDVGMLFTPVKTMEPTLGISIADFGGTPLKANSDQYGKPQPRQPAVNTGVSIKPYMSGSMYLLTTVDAHAINQPLHYSKKVNFGSELGLGKMVKIQAGLHQGELSGGFQLDAWLLILRFATYAEQLGTYAGEDPLLTDRRYVMQLKVLL